MHTLEAELKSVSNEYALIGNLIGIFGHLKLRKNLRINRSCFANRAPGANPIKLFTL